MQQAVGHTNDNFNDNNSKGDGNREICWDLATLQKYISFVKSNIDPILSPEAKCLLVKNEILHCIIPTHLLFINVQMRYYQLQRQSDDRSSCRTTIRLLESLGNNYCLQ